MRLAYALAVLRLTRSRYAGLRFVAFLAFLTRGMQRRIFIGTAGWSIPRASAPHFPVDGTHLQRYGRAFRCAEINSCFYRSHAESTYAKWAEATPAAFRFSVKVPQVITHELRLRRSRAPFERFLSETNGLGRRRGPLLIQLPGSFAFEARAAATFFDMVRARYDGPLVCEPRNPGWFDARADALLSRHGVARVVADPAITEMSKVPGGSQGLVYFRLHGAPRMYWSPYDSAFLSHLATRIRQLAMSMDVWCVFDNTASGAAIENAWELQQLMFR